MTAPASEITETAVVAFATFFATVGPLDVSAVFVAMTPHATPRARLTMVLRGVSIAAIILVTFAFAGRPLLSALGISLASLRVAGGILLLLIGIDMVFARSSGGVSTTQEETMEATGKDDISVFPLATPLIAGPGAMGASILLMANAEGHWLLQAVVITMLLTVLLLTLLGLLLANQVVKLFGVTGLHVISRVFGVLLTALAVQFIFDGIQQSGLLSGL
jgi:multiple antibiotic resistance protein